jgi:hypothetical protein
MMKSHLDSTTAEVVARLKSDWTADVAAYYAKAHGRRGLRLAARLSGLLRSWIRGRTWS